MKRIIINFCILLYIQACHSKVPPSVTVSMGGCDNVEVSQDLKISIMNNQEYLNANGIKVSFENQSGICGYIFSKNQEKKVIETIMTDIDDIVKPLSFLASISIR